MATRTARFSFAETCAYHVLRRVARVIGAMPPALAARFGRFLGRTAWPWARRRRRIAQDNLHKVFGSRCTDRRRRTIAFRSFVGLFEDAMVLVAAAHTPTQHPRRSGLCRIQNESEFLRWTTGGRGAILVSGHLSNFYLMVGFLGRIGVDLAVLVRPLAFRPAERLLTELRSASGVTTFDQGRSPMGLVRHLARGGVTWFSLDQNARHGVLVEALGRPATAYPGPVTLARRLGIPIIPVFVNRTGTCRYVLEVTAPITLPQREATAEETAADLMQLMRRLDAHILARPEQWLWCHRRWRTAERLAAKRGAE